MFISIVTSLVSADISNYQLNDNKDCSGSTALQMEVTTGGPISCVDWCNSNPQCKGLSFHWCHSKEDSYQDAVTVKDVKLKFIHQCYELS